MNILVTGGAGFIGSHLVDALIDRGYFVRILDNLEPQVHGGKVPGYLNLDAEYIIGDVCDYEYCVAALQDIDVVYHLAALVGVGQSMTEITRYAKNTTGAATLLQAIISMKRRPVRLIVASSMSIYGECQGDCPVTEAQPLRPSSIYAITKRDHEEMLMVVGAANEIPTVALRYFNVYGDRQALSNPYTGVVPIFANKIIHGEAPVIYDDGNQRRDFVHVSDVVQANLIALDNQQMDYRAFNVGTGEATRIIDVALSIAYCLVSDIKPLITNQHRHGDIYDCYPDITAIRRIGYVPSVKLAEGLRYYAEELQHGTQKLSV